jgi:hypothetical protein
MSLENIYKKNQNKLAVKTANYQKQIAKEGSALVGSAMTVPKLKMSDLRTKNSAYDLENPKKYLG